MADDVVYGEYGLALRLGMTVGQLRNRLSHREFVEWGAYFRRLRVEEGIAASKAQAKADNRRRRR